MLRWSAPRIAELAVIARWMYDDLARAARAERSLEGFGNEMMHLYEEVELLFRLGRSMVTSRNPEGFVDLLVRELQETLPFEWIGVKFGPEVASLDLLSGRWFAAGKPPGADSDFESLLQDAIEGLKPGKWTLFDPPSPAALSDPDSGPRAGSDAVARTAGSQVLAHPIVRGGRVVGALFAGNKRGHDNEVSSVETQLLDAGADYLGVFIENAALYADQLELFMGMLEALTSSIDAKDRYTCGHSERVAHLAWKLALAVGMDEENAERVRISGLVHDVGKIGVPEGVLTKPGKLTDDEFAQIKKHPEIGHRILRDIPKLGDVLPGVLYHHERYDGRGYPEGLAGEQIPFIARLLALADSFDAMSSNRSYRAAMDREKVLAEVLRCAGAQFDPDLARAFVALDFREYDRLVARHQAHDYRAAA